MPVTKGDQIELDGTKYLLAKNGRIAIKKINQLPQKTVIGDYHKSSNPLVSSIVVSDQRKGIGILDADRPEEIERCWFSNSEIAYRGISLPRLATEETDVPRTIVNPTSTTSA